MEHLRPISSSLSKTKEEINITLQQQCLNTPETSRALEQSKNFPINTSPLLPNLSALIRIEHQKTSFKVLQVSNTLYSNQSEMSIIPRIFDPFSPLDLLDPFANFPFFNNNALSVPRSTLASETSAFANTRIDWKETPEAHVFKADLPGLKKEEVKVEIEEGRVLQISGERSKQQEEKNDKWHRVERSSGKFLRRFRLPENTKVDQVKAVMEDGVLTITVPKEEVKKPEVKAIDISG